MAAACMIYKPYSSFPESAEMLAGIPEEHPAIVLEIHDCNNIPAGWEHLSRVEYDSLKAVTDPLVDAWRASLPPPGGGE